MNDAELSDLMAAYLIERLRDDVREDIVNDLKARPAELTAVAEGVERGRALQSKRASRP